MNKIHIISTGGTISGLKNPQKGTDIGEMSGQDLFSPLQLPSGYEFCFHEAAAIDSSLMSFNILFSIRQKIQAIFEDKDSLGVIVTHGTDTLEESAYFLSLVYPQGETRPVILTGSQRTSDETGSDAFSNLQHAVWAVLSPQTKNLGAAVLFNQALFMPRYVHKSHTHFLHAFGCQYFGMLGTVDGPQVSIVQKPAFSEHYDIKNHFPKTDIYKASLDCEGDILPYYAEKNYFAVIIEAFGRGNVTEKLAQNIKRLSDSNVLVLVVSDCAAGSVKAEYNFCGGLGKLAEYGAIPAFDYSAKKARIKLAVLYAAGIREKAEIQKHFEK